MNHDLTPDLGTRTGRPQKPLVIVDADRDKLSMVARWPTSTQAAAMRARIVLSCREGMSNSELARQQHIRARPPERGGNGSENSDWMGCWMCRGPVRPARLRSA